MVSLLITDNFLPEAGECENRLNTPYAEPCVVGHGRPGLAASEAFYQTGLVLNDAGIDLIRLP